MIRLYFLQAFYHLRENPIITWVSILGTAMAICMIMVLMHGPMQYFMQVC